MGSVSGPGAEEESFYLFWLLPHQQTDGLKRRPSSHPHREIRRRLHNGKVTARDTLLLGGCNFLQLGRRHNRHEFCHEERREFEFHMPRL